VSAASCSTPESTPGDITEEGLRNDVSVGFQYISFWLGGRGAAGINNLMEDAATAEISRSQIWQWVRHGKFTASRCARSSTRRRRRSTPRSATRSWEKGRPDETREIFERVSLSDEFPEFLTIPAYKYLD
jgi:malate synthase